MMEKGADYARSLADDTGLDADQVQKVLERLGLDRALEAVERGGGDVSNLSLDDFKLAVRVGKNTLHV